MTDEELMGTGLRQMLERDAEPEGGRLVPEAWLTENLPPWFRLSAPVEQDHEHVWFTLYGEAFWRCRCGQVNHEAAPEFRAWTDPFLPVGSAP